MQALHQNAPDPVLVLKLAMNSLLRLKPRQFVSHVRGHRDGFFVVPSSNHVHRRLLHSCIVTERHIKCSSSASGSSKSNEPEDEDEDKEEEEEEGNTMVRLDSDSREGIGQREVFGPLAILLVGFMKEEYVQVLDLMAEMEAEEVKVIPCSKTMLKGTLSEALHSQLAVEYEAPPLGTRRAIFLSGMYGSEVMEVVGGYREAGLPPAVFGAFVPNNANRIVSDLVAEISAEDAAMKKKMQQQQQQR